MIIQAILLGCIAFIGKCDLATGDCLIQKPIVLGPLVGAVLGDVQSGIIIGAFLELAFIGSQSIGAFIPPNVIVGGVLGTAFAITTGRGAEVAVTLAYPIALLASVIDNFLFTTIRPMLGKLADSYAEKGNTRAVGMVHMGAGFLTCTILAVLVASGFLLGSTVIENVVNSIPAVITNGLTIATGLLPALGFAMLAQMIMNKKVIAFFFLGFLLSAYLGVPVVGIAALGVLAAMIKVDFNNTSPVTVEDGGADDDF